MHSAASRRRRFLVPEVVQTSAMDCGPASLKCLLEGFYIPVSYGRLREACQTDVDGTSIDTLEEVASQLGLQAEQVMLPVDHVLLPHAQALPALAIVRLPHGDTHFVVLWRRHGAWVQVMDPATGHRWSRVSQVLDELYVHSLPVAADAWLAWAASEPFLVPLRHRMAKVGVTSRTIERLIHDALAPAQWLPLACLAAAVRMLDTLVGYSGLRRQTAWVDPAVQLWNRSLFDNLHYGTAQTPSRPLPEVIKQAELFQVLEKLPDGLQSALGESGSRLSGGEGQRVRFGCALLRPETRLVILDEAFRGLDRGRRRDLLSRARHVWADATLFCITHDIGETQGFERVLVIDHGHVVEDGAPHDLLMQPESKYRELIEAEAAVRTGMWSGPRWRHLELQGGQLHDTSREGESL